MAAPGKAAIEKVVGLFGEYVPDALNILLFETSYTGTAVETRLIPSSLEVSPMAAFCYKLHMDQRVQEDDQFPLHPESVEKASTACLLTPWKGGRITPSYLSNLIQEAPSEATQRKLEMIAVLEEREPVARWLQLREEEDPLLRLAIQMFKLPTVADTAGNLYVAQWEFDRKFSGKHPYNSTVLWAAKVLFQHVNGHDRFKKFP